MMIRLLFWGRHILLPCDIARTAWAAVPKEAWEGEPVYMYTNYKHLDVYTDIEERSGCTEPHKP